MGVTVHTNRFVGSYNQHRDRAKRFTNYIVKRRTNNDKDRSIAQGSARDGSRRGVWSGEPVGAGKCQRNGRAELNERGDRPEVVRSLGEERLGSSRWPARR